MNYSVDLQAAETIDSVVRNILYRHWLIDNLGENTYCLVDRMPDGWGWRYLRFLHSEDMLVFKLRFKI